MYKKVVESIIVLSAVVTLTACNAGNEKSADIAKDNHEVAEATKNEQTDGKEGIQDAEDEKSESPVSTPEPTVEPTPMPTSTPIPIVYEEIDMESTLPAQEWIATFHGIINEPKFVVCNDETNKKVIVENEGEVVFDEGDILVIYNPANVLLLASDGRFIEEVVTYDTGYTVVEFKEGREPVPNTITTEFFYRDSDEEGKITCHLKKSN